MEISLEDLGIKQLPTLPHNIKYSSMVLHNGTILLCGGSGNEKKCLQLDHGIWKEHSTFNEARYSRNGHSAVTTQTATFLFGIKTYEYLPKDSNTWLPGKNEIPVSNLGWWSGHAISIKSGQAILLIGGSGTRLFSFNVKDHTFQELPSQLNMVRLGSRCAFIPNTNKILITGGQNRGGYLDSTEILDTEDGSVTMASPMNFKRASHGIGFMTINGEDRLAVFGGVEGKQYSTGFNFRITPIQLDSLELYNPHTHQWETTGLKLTVPMYDFGFVTVKLSDIISKM